MPKTPKNRVTVSLPAQMLRELDRHAEAVNLNRSEAVELAVEGWVQTRIEGDQERISHLSRRLAQVESTVELAGQEIAEMLRMQFSGLAGVEDSDLQRRAKAALRRRNGGPQWR